MNQFMLNKSTLVQPLVDIIHKCNDYKKTMLHLSHTSESHDKLISLVDTILDYVTNIKPLDFIDKNKYYKLIRRDNGSRYIIEVDRYHMSCKFHLRNLNNVTLQVKDMLNNNNLENIANVINSSYYDDKSEDDDEEEEEEEESEEEISIGELFHPVDYSGLFSESQEEDESEDFETEIEQFLVDHIFGDTESSYD